MTAAHRHRARTRLGRKVRARAARRPASQRASDWALRRLGNAASGVMLLALLGGGALALRLSAGPVSLGDLAQFAAEQVSTEMPGRSIEIEDLVFDLSRKGLPPGLRIKGLTLRDGAGAVIARAPEVSVRVHVLDALKGVVSPTQIVVSGLAVTITRDADGVVHGGVGMPGAAQTHGTAPALGAVGMLREAQTMIGGLDRLKLVEGRDLRLTFNDIAAGRSWTASGMQMRVRRDADALSAELLAAQPGAPAPWLRLIARRASAAEDEIGETVVSMTLAGATGAEVAAAFPPLAVLGAVSAPLTGRFSGVITDAGATRVMTARLSAGAGLIRGLDGDAAQLDGAQISLRLEADADRLVIDAAEITGGLGSLRLSGAGTLRRDAAGRALGAGLSLIIEDVSLTEAAGFAEPMGFGPGRLAGEMSFDTQAFRLDEAVIEAPGLALSASGGASLVDGGWRGDLRARAIAPIDAATLAPNWPRGLAPGARNWVADHILGGTIDTLDLAARFADGAASADMDFTFSDARASVLAGLPTLEGAVGQGRVTIAPGGPGRFDAFVTHAHTVVPGGGVITLDGSSFAIADVAVQIPFGDVSMVAEGAVADILILIDQPPLGFISALGVDLGIVGGRGAGTTQVRLPLLNDLALGDVTLSVAAELTDLSLALPGVGLPARARRAALRVDQMGLTLTADAVVDGLPMSVAWEETFAPAPGAAPTQINLAGAIGQAALTRLGVADMIIGAGAGWARARIAIARQGAASLSADVNFDKAALEIPAIGWRKGVDARARVSLAGRAGGATLTLSRLTANAPGLGLEGKLTADLAGGGLTSVRLSRLVLAGLAEGAIDYAVADAGATLRFDGPFLDLAALGDAAGDGDGGEVGALTLDARIDRLTLAQGMVLHGARAEAELGEGGAATATLTGKAGGGAPVAATWKRAAAGAPSHLRITADDAGAALRDLDLFEDGRGGALTLDANLTGTGQARRISGTAVIKGMQLRADGALVRALAAASLFGVVERAGTGGLSFDRIEAPFVLEDQVLRLDNALARGSSLGITLGGIWDRRRDVVDLRGVLSPAYAINGVLNRVPIVGALLGGEGEGLIGVTFAVTGSADDPRISANPLSALTPGVLRGVFGGTRSETRIPDAPAAPEPAPAPAPEPERVER
jgi:hypothetical protein